VVQGMDFGVITSMKTIHRRDTEVLDDGRNSYSYVTKPIEYLILKNIEFLFYLNSLQIPEAECISPA
jgi:hypothetical protein